MHHLHYCDWCKSYLLDILELLLFCIVSMLIQSGWIKNECLVSWGHISMVSCMKDESLGLVSVSRLKAPKLSVSSQSRTKFWNLSPSCLVCFNFTQFRRQMSRFNKIKPKIQSFSSIKASSRLGLVKKKPRLLFSSHSNKLVSSCPSVFCMRLT